MQKWLPRVALAVLLVFSFTLPTVEDSVQATTGNGEGPEPVDIGPKLRSEELEEIEIDSSSVPLRTFSEAALQTYEPTPGTERFFLSLDDTQGYYFKDYTLRAVGEYAEIWVANDRDFPQEERNDSVEITDEQVAYILSEFDTNIYGKVTEFFGMPNSHNGENQHQLITDTFGEDYYVSSDGSDRNIILVDNVRDANFYDPEFPSYIAGFYSPVFEMYTDRNIITIDAYDWENRVGPDAARPHLYEGTVAHEYQHLIHDDNDSDEETWINEGMSDFAEFLVGYGHPDSHVDFFRDHPENSLVAWEDQGPYEILADYGIAYLFQLYLNDHYGGGEFIQALATNEKNGIEGVNDTLQAFGYEVTFEDVYRDFQTALVIDAEDGENEKYGFKSIDFTINVDTEEAYNTPGAPAWGTDFVKLERKDVQSLFFDGFDFLPTEWTVADDPENADNDVFWGGAGSLANHFMIKAFDLSDVEGAELTFDTWYEIEEAWDYGFVQVSTDGGETWTSLANENTRSDLDPNAHPNVVENVPGFTGSSGGWTTQTFDLSAYDGQQILLAFRYVTDWASEEAGWYVDNIRIDAVGYENDGGNLDDFQGLNEVVGRYVDYLVTFIQEKPQGNHTVIHVDPFNMTSDEEKELESFTQLNPGDELVMTVTYGAPQGDLAYADYEYDVRYHPHSVSELQVLVEHFNEEGAFRNDGAVRSLLVHLMAVDRFERQGDADKVVKHMQNFKQLLGHQGENGLISAEALDVLQSGADTVIAKWQE